MPVLLNIMTHILRPCRINSSECIELQKIKDLFWLTPVNKNKARVISFI